jgi:oligo-alginate lyase
MSEPIKKHFSVFVTHSCPVVKVPVFSAHNFSTEFWKQSYRTDRFFRRDMFTCDPDWGNPYPPAPISSTLALGRDKKFFYIGVRSYEPEPEKLLAKHLENQKEIWLDDSFEFFFDTEHNHRDYFHLIVNSAGFFYTERIKRGRKVQWVVYPETRTFRWEKGWGLEVSIPLNSFTVRKSAVWGFNAGRNFGIEDNEKRVKESLVFFNSGRWDVPEGFADLYFRTPGHYLRKFFINKQRFTIPEQKRLVHYGKNILSLSLNKKTKRRLNVNIRIGGFITEVSIPEGKKTFSFPFVIKKQVSLIGNPFLSLILKDNNRVLYTGRWMVILDRRDGKKEISEWISSLRFSKHPRMLYKEENINAVREQVRTDKSVSDIYDAIKKEADEFVKGFVPPPDKPAEHLTHYRCFKHGARLEYVAPGRHRCPVDGEILTGKLLDASYLFWEHARYFNKAAELAFLYLIEGNKEYRDKAKYILLFYARNYHSFPLRSVYPHSARIRGAVLTESGLVLYAALAYDALYNDLTPKERRTINNRFFKPACKPLAEYPGGKGNWKSQLNLALVAVGIATGNRDYINLGAGAERGFLFDIRNCVTKDGFWHQGAIGYHFFVLGAYLWVAELLKQSFGLNLYRYKRFQKMFIAPLLFAYPDGKFPNIGTGGGGKISDYKAYYNIALARISAMKQYESVIRPGVEMSRSGDALMDFIRLTPEIAGYGKILNLNREYKIPSANMSDIGYAVLRSGKGKETCQAVFVYGKTHHGKGQPDKLSFDLFGRGRLLAPDPGYASYTNPLSPGWYYRTIAHNTIVVDSISQSSGNAKLLCFSDGAVKVAGAYSKDIYPGIESFRILMLKEDILFDIFAINGEEKHTFDYFIHHYGKVEVEGRFREIRSIHPTGGYQYIKDIKKFAGRKNLWQAGWILDKGVVSSSAFYSLPAGELYTGEGPRYGGDIKNRDEDMPIPLVMQRTAGTKNVIYLTTMTICRDKYEEQKAAIFRKSNCLICNCESGGRTFRILLGEKGLSFQEEGGCKENISFTRPVKLPF